jgi:hypothetical protein
VVATLFPPPFPFVGLESARLLFVLSLLVSTRFVIGRWGVMLCGAFFCVVRREGAVAVSSVGFLGYFILFTSYSKHLFWIGTEFYLHVCNIHMCVV